MSSEHDNVEGINPELTFFLNPDRIAEGILLFEKENGVVTPRGKVIFSLEELPELVLFVNDKGI